MNQNCELYLARRGALIVVASIEFRLVFSAANKCPYENSFHPFRNLVWDSSDGQSWNFTSHFSPPTYLSVETTRTSRVLSWIIRKKERKKKKENRKSIDYCDDFITIGFITGRDRYLEREPVLQPVFLTQHVTARGSYFRESREIYEIQLEATTSLFEVYTAFEKES